MLSSDRRAHSFGPDELEQHAHPNLLSGARLGQVGGWLARIVTASIVVALLAVTLPGLAGYHSITITSGSMGRALPMGSVAVTRTINFRDVHVGDVVAFRRPGAGIPVVHRVVEIQQTDAGPVALTRGDANSSNDADVLPLGEGRGDRVAYHVPLIGYAFVFVRTPAGIIALTLVTAAALLLRRNKRGPGTEAHATPTLAA